MRSTVILAAGGTVRRDARSKRRDENAMRRPRARFDDAARPRAWTRPMRELPRAVSSSVCALGLCGDERRARVALSPPAADVSAQPPCRAAWRLDLEFDLEFADVGRHRRHPSYGNQSGRSRFSRLFGTRVCRAAFGLPRDRNATRRKGSTARARGQSASTRYGGFEPTARSRVRRALGVSARVWFGEERSREASARESGRAIDPASRS
eukprot:31348-Pelagococcus_subviridis.AAC.17